MTDRLPAVRQGAPDALWRTGPDGRRSRKALALTLERSGNAGHAALVYRRALTLDPGDRDSELLYANLLFRAGRFEAAAAAFRRGLIHFGPRSALYSNLGAAWRELGDGARALGAFRRALCLAPNDPTALRNLANLLRLGDRLDVAAHLYRRAMAIAPNDATLRWNLSMALLKAGRLRDGFAAFEARWHGDRYSPKRRSFAVPQWDGGPFDGRTLFVSAEQGFGDALQFARFLPRAARRKGRDGRLILESRPELIPLLERLPGIDRVIALGARRPPIDLHMPLLSLPHALGVASEADLSTDTPYLSVPPGAAFETPEIAPGTLNVGFVFAGNPDYPGDRDRSTRIADWDDVLAIPGVRFHCLQKGAAEAAADTAPPTVIRLNRRIGSFVDTAIAMERLDLIITTCTSTAHLAGALGRPVWIALARNADWRWMTGRADSPWYPTARLYRQPAPGDWPSVFAAIARDLMDLANAGTETGRRL